VRCRRRGEHRGRVVRWAGLDENGDGQSAITAISVATRTRSTEDEVLIPRYAMPVAAARMTMNSTQGTMVICSTSPASSWGCTRWSA
jgi:hypothetical protein